jgi:MFS family permease
VKEKQDPYASLRLFEFRNLVIASFLITVAQMIQEVVIGYELYRLTHDPFVLGLIGLVAAVPFMSLSLFGGHIADRYSKRKIILWSVAGVLLSSLLLQVLARQRDAMSQSFFLFGVYTAIFIIGICTAFYSPTVSSLRAFLVPPKLYENAATWSSSAWQTGAIVGPAAGGFLYEWFGFANTLLLVAFIIGGVFLLYASIGDKPVFESPKNERILKSIGEGINFVRRTKIILYSISLDLFSVMFGGVVAILPIYAEDILKVGAQGLGILRAASSVGGVLALMLMARVSPMEHAWRNLLLAVTGFGICILAFAVSPWMILSVIALFLSGASDSVSVVIRATILQIMTPDEMRGRVQAVNGIFLASSNELGGFESGLAAKLMGTVPSVVFGGTMTFLVLAFVYFRSKDLFKLRISS